MVSVTNDTAAPASCNVWLEFKQTSQRWFGAKQVQALSPNPFIAATGAPAGGGGGAPGVFGSAWHGDNVLAAPFDQFSQLYYADLTINSGGILRIDTGENIGAGGNLGFVLMVDGVLTITGTGFIDVSGGNAVAAVGGLGGGNGGSTGGAHAGATADTGAGNDVAAPFQTLFPIGNLKKAGFGGAGTSGVGGTTLAAHPWEDDDSTSHPSLGLGSFGSNTAQAMGLINGSGGGGSGAGNGVASGGGGGGGGGIRWIFARDIVAPVGSIRARGGNGAAGAAAGCGGGGGGLGGCIVVYTNSEVLNPNMFDVSGGLGGASGGGAGVAGNPGNVGRICIITPSGVTWIG